MFGLAVLIAGCALSQTARKPGLYVVFVTSEGKITARLFEKDVPKCLATFNDGVPLETRKVLLGHKSGDITTHYSAPELAELLEATNRVARPKVRTLLRVIA